MKKPNMAMELLHYVVVYAVLAGSWTTIMNYFKGDLMLTVVTGFIVFVVADILAHRFILGEKIV
jgi:hypothetical protein